jgi:hypothetical protein
MSANFTRGGAAPGAALSWRAMAFPRPKSPAAAWRDFCTFIGQRGRHKILFALIAVAMPLLIVTGFYFDSRVDPPGPQLIYAESWPADRSDEQIKAQQKIDQARRDAALAERRRQFQALERRLGM